MRTYKLAALSSLAKTLRDDLSNDLVLQRQTKIGRNVMRHEGYMLPSEWCELMHSNKLKSRISKSRPRLSGSNSHNCIASSTAKKPRFVHFPNYVHLD